MKRLNTPSTERLKYRNQITILSFLALIMSFLALNESVQKQIILNELNKFRSQNTLLNTDNEQLSALKDFIEEDLVELSQRYALLDSDFNDLSDDYDELQNRIYELMGDNADLNSLVTLLLNPIASGISIKDHFDILLKFMNEPGIDSTVKEKLKFNILTTYLSRVVSIGYKDRLGISHESNLYGVRSGEYVKSLTGVLMFEYASGDTERSLRLDEASTFEQAKESFILLASDLTTLSNGSLMFDVHVSDEDGMQNLYLTVDIDGVRTMILHIAYIRYNQIYSVHTQNISIYDINEEDRRYDKDSDMEPYYYNGSVRSQEIVEA